MPRVTPHFKVQTSIKNHRKMAAVYWDNDLGMLWVRLGVEAIERYADRTGDTFIISSRELVALAGTKRVDSAERLLRNLIETSPILGQKLGNTWSITMPNLSQKQGFKLKKGIVTEGSSSATSSSTSIKNIEAEKAWRKAQQTAKKYGKRWGKLTPARLKPLLSRMGEHSERGDEVVAQAIDGYVALRKGGDFDWKQFLVPDTILRASKFPTYLDAYRKPAIEPQPTEPTAEFKKKCKPPKRIAEE